MVMSTNIFLDNSALDPGFVKLGDGMTVPSPADFDLTSDTKAIANALSGNPTAISGGTPIAGLTVDFLGRAVPSATSGKTDIGAFQFDSVAAADAGTSPSPPTAGGSGTTGASDPTNTAKTSPAVEGGCSCRVAGRNARTGAAGWVTLLIIGWGLRRCRRSGDT